jgi:CubicO group peptidase (beta-lactamase class C family)
MEMQRQSRMSQRACCLILLITISLAGCGQASTLPVTGNAVPGYAAFDGSMLGLLDAWNVPGGALAIGREGEVVFARGYGYADREQGLPVHPDSLFRIASVSKPFTAVAILQLVEQGRLDLDQPAFELLQGLLQPGDEITDARLQLVTIRQLLEHAGGWDRTASFDPMFMSAEIGLVMESPEPADCTTIIRYMLTQFLDFDPGSTYAYSNFGYCVLGRVIEVLTGRTYENAVREAILEPVGIENMRLGRTLPSQRFEGEVQYYDAPGAPLADSVFLEDWQQLPMPDGGFYLEAMDSHGGWIAAAPDLVRFAAALDPSAADPLLNAETTAMMLERPDLAVWEDSESFYALGWEVRPSGKESSFWHAGSLPGTAAVLWRTRDGLIWAALFNSWPEPSSDAFLVAVVTAMGRAIALTTLRPYLPWIVLLLVGAVTFAGWTLLRRRRRSVHQS